MKHALLIACLAGAITASAQVPDYVPTNGLIAWYPLDGNATDLGDNGFNGTESGTTGAVSREGTTNGALKFNGSSHVNLGNSSVLNPPEMSVSCWFQIQSWNTQSGLSTILGRNLNDGSHRYGFNMGIFGPNNTAIGQTGLRFGFDDDSNSGNLIHDYDIPEPLDLNEWYHFGITMNLQEEELIFYLNGAVVATENIPSAGVNPIDTDVLMGFYRPNGAHSFNGLLDDIGIWNRTLSDVEMTGIYSETPPLLGCVDASACNYDAEANTDDGSCAYGCLFCGAGTHWDAVTEMCIADGPGEVDENCTLMNLQDLAEGYQVLLDHTADQDSVIITQQAWIDSAQGNISNSPTGPCSGENSLNYFGEDYDIVEINGRCWFGQNLNTSQYSNGDSLATDISIPMWNGTTNGACDAYGFSSINANTYGLLYNWHAVTDPRNLCPTGWHVASDSDWKSAEIGHGMTPEEADLTNFRGSPAGSRFKASHSNSPSWNGTDSLHFGGLPGGWRNENGSFSGLGTSAAWWTNSGYGCCYAQYRIMTTNEDRVFRNNLYYYFFGRASSGLSVRCVKD